MRSNIRLFRNPMFSSLFACYEHDAGEQFVPILVVRTGKRFINLIGITLKLTMAIMLKKIDLKIM